MRRFMIGKIASHLADFSPRLRSNTKALYQVIESKLPSISVSYYRQNHGCFVSPEKNVMVTFQKYISYGQEESSMVLVVKIQENTTNVIDILSSIFFLFSIVLFRRSLILNWSTNCSVIFTTYVISVIHNATLIGQSKNRLVRFCIDPNQLMHVYGCCYRNHIFRCNSNA